MEQQFSDTTFELKVDYESGNSFKELIRWSNFVALFVLILTGLGLLILAIAGIGLLASSEDLKIGTFYEGGSASGLIQMVLLVAFLLLFSVTAVLLFRFSSLCRRGFNHRDQSSFNKGLKALYNYFLVGLVLAVLGVISGLVELFLLV